MPLPSSIVPEEMRDDPWLQSHLRQMVEDEILGKQNFFRSNLL
jgi:hypothetical protein